MSYFPVSDPYITQNGTFTRFQLVCDLRTDGPTDGRTDRRTDRRTDIPSYRDARTHLIKTVVLGHSLIRSLVPLTRSLASDCSLCSRPPLRSLVCSLVHFAHSLARGTVNDWMAILSVFFSIFDHSVPASRSHNLSVHLSEHLSVHTPVSLYVLLIDSASVRVTNITTGRACKSFGMPW